MDEFIKKELQAMQKEMKENSLEIELFNGQTVLLNKTSFKNAVNSVIDFEDLCSCKCGETCPINCECTLCHYFGEVKHDVDECHIFDVNRDEVNESECDCFGECSIWCSCPVCHFDTEENDMDCNDSKCIDFSFNCGEENCPICNDFIVDEKSCDCPVCKHEDKIDLNNKANYENYESKDSCGCNFCNSNVKFNVVEYNPATTSYSFSLDGHSKTLNVTELSLQEAKRTPIIDMNTGNVNLNYKLQDKLEDYVMPMVTNYETTKTDVIEDLDYFKTKLRASLGIPKEYLNNAYGLGNLDKRFADRYNKDLEVLKQFKFEWAKDNFYNLTPNVKVNNSIKKNLQDSDVLKDFEWLMEKLEYDRCVDSFEYFTKEYCENFAVAKLYNFIFKNNLEKFYWSLPNKVYEIFCKLPIWIRQKFFLGYNIPDNTFNINQGYYLNRL